MLRFPRLLLIGWLLAALCGGASAAEDGYPSRLVKVIVPFPPGSTLDALARIVTDQLAQRWGQPVIIENISGGGGNIGTDRFARSPPDGYTLMLSPPGPLTINPLLYGDAAYDPAKFVPITLLARVPNVLIVRNSLGATSVAALVAVARANPGKLTYASQGVGPTAFLTAKLFETRADVRMAHVPYRGAGPALIDLLAGQGQVMFDNLPSSIGHIKGGKLRALAVTTAARSEALPDISTVGEFVPGYEASAFFGINAPKATPPEIIERLNKEINAILAEPGAKARFADLGGMVLPGSPANFGKLVADETEKWAKVVKFANIKPE